MILTPELKAQIDAMSITSLLHKIRFAPIGDPLFQDDSGDYCLKRYAELRDKDPDGAVAASKTIGWEREKW